MTERDITAEGFKSKYGLYQWSQGSHSRQLRAGGKVVGDEYAARAGTFDRLLQANAGSRVGAHV